MKRLKKTSISIKSDEWTFFYQDVLGRHIYLLPLNLNMLLECTSKISSFTSKVLQIEEEDVGLSERKQHNLNN